MYDVLAWMLGDALRGAEDGHVPPVGHIRAGEGGDFAVDAPDGRWWPAASQRDGCGTICSDLPAVVENLHSVAAGVVRRDGEGGGRWRLTTATGLPAPLSGRASTAPLLDELETDGPNGWSKGYSNEGPAEGGRP
jgi:hypothetical protein